MARLSRHIQRWVISVVVAACTSCNLALRTLPVFLEKPIEEMAASTTAELATTVDVEARSSPDSGAISSTSVAPMSAEGSIDGIVDVPAVAKKMTMWKRMSKGLKRGRKHVWNFMKKAGNAIKQAFIALYRIYMSWWDYVIGRAAAGDLDEEAAALEESLNVTATPESLWRTMKRMLNTSVIKTCWEALVRPLKSFVQSRNKSQVAHDVNADVHDISSSFLTLIQGHRGPACRGRCRKKGRGWDAGKRQRKKQTPLGVQEALVEPYFPQTQEAAAPPQTAAVHENQLEGQALVGMEMTTAEESPELAEKATDGNSTVRVAGGLKKWVKLVVGIIGDVIGMATYFVPGVGEFFDLAWAWVQGTMLWGLFGRIPGAIIGVFEELIPFTDAVPTFTLSWYGSFYDNGFAKLIRMLGFGELSKDAQDKLNSTSDRLIEVSKETGKDALKQAALRKLKGPAK